MPLHNDVRVSGVGAAAAATGDKSIIRSTRSVIMIAMLMTALLLQLKVLSYDGGCRRADPGSARESGEVSRLSPARKSAFYQVSLDCTWG